MLGWIAILIQGLLGGVALSAPEIIRRVLIAFGVGTVTFLGSQALFDSMETHILGGFSGLPPMVAQVVGIMRLDTFVTVIMSAFSIRITMNLLGGTASKQIKF